MACPRSHGKFARCLSFPPSQGENKKQKGDDDWVAFLEKEKKNSPHPHPTDMHIPES